MTWSRHPNRIYTGLLSTQTIPNILQNAKVMVQEFWVIRKDWSAIGINTGLYSKQFILRLGPNKRVEGVYKSYMTEEERISNNVAEWIVKSIYPLHFKVRSLAPRWRMKFGRSDWEKLQEYSTVFRGFSIDERSKITFSWDDKLASWSVMGIYSKSFKMRCS